MKTYCFRAEAEVDAEGLFALLDEAGITAVNARVERSVGCPLTGGVYEFQSDADTVADLVAVARRVEDGHVIVRTLRAGTHRGQDMSVDVR